nr:tRNA (uracil(54)-C(5))-methyltransferase homolog isoform X2 [Halyomorpha halys]
MTFLVWHSRKVLSSNVKSTFHSLRKHLHEIFPQIKKELPPVTNENQYEVLSRVVAPLWDIDYVEQLMGKKKWTRQVVATIKSRKISKFKTVIHEILPSPLIESYRNKDEFSIRQGIDGNDKTVGFFIGSPAEGNVVCVQPTKLISLKDCHMLFAEVFQQLIRDSPLKACHDFHDGGYWRNIIVRSNRKNEIMLIVVVHPGGASTADMEESKQLIRDRLLSTEANVKSLYFQACPHVRCRNDQAPFELLYGDEYIYETIHDITVRVSPDSFLQVNSEAAEILYDAALGFANLTDKTTVLDLYSGIGVISLLASRQVRGCVGIEHTPSAVEDAIFNASYNNITNCSFVQGRVEKKIKSVLKELNLASDLVAFINPGRAGIKHE